jgi:hypothetical protein
VTPAVSDVPRLLAAVGDTRAADLLPLVYEELRKLAAARRAAEPAGQTLQPTALVHEAYLRLVDLEKDPAWNGRPESGRRHRRRQPDTFTLKPRATGGRISH